MSVTTSSRFFSSLNRAERSLFVNQPPHLATVVSGYLLKLAQCGKKGFAFFGAATSQIYLLGDGYYTLRNGILSSFTGVSQPLDLDIAKMFSCRVGAGRGTELLERSPGVARGKRLFFYSGEGLKQWDDKSSENNEKRLFPYKLRANSLGVSWYSLVQHSALAALISGVWGTLYHIALTV